MRLDSEAIHRRIAALLSQRKTFVVATIVETRGSVPQTAGSRMIVHSDASYEFTIGGGTFEAEVIQDGLSLFSGNSPQTREYKLTKPDLGMYCQGIVKVFFEKQNPRAQLLIFGGGHVGQALSRISSATDLFSVVVVDDRREYANSKKHPSANRVILTDREFSTNIPSVDSETFIVIVTRCHATDKLLVKKYVYSDAAYIGLIGSRPKIKQFARELEAEGVSAKSFEQIHAPIGVPIGGKDPAEVAISILAEVIQIKNAKKIAPSRKLQSVSRLDSEA
jgi:xanthine dehydrogenase accessory factor